MNCVSEKEPKKKGQHTQQDRPIGARSQRGQQRPPHRAQLWDLLCSPLCTAEAGPGCTRSSPETSPEASFSTL